MKRRRLFWVLYPSFLFLILVAVIVSSVGAARECKSLYISQTEADLAARAHMLQDELQVFELLPDPAQTDRRCKKLGDLTGTRFTVILPDGRVTGDSRAAPAEMENHGGRPEVIPALVGRRGQAIRFSKTLGREMMYVAIPLTKDGEVLAVTRAAIDLTTVSDSLRSIYLRAALGGFLVLLIGALLDLVISRRLSRQLEFLSEGATRIARGKRGLKLPRFKIDEIDTLARSMNIMSRQLDERIAAIARERNEKAAILAGMTEGVLAVDRDERILHLNRAAEKILRVDFTSARGKLIHEAIRNPELQAFVHEALVSTNASETEVTLFDQPVRHVTLQGAPLFDGEGQRIGAVAVMNEVTDLRRLETIRRDFVANVSHELRTPVTAIRGAAEALRSEAPPETAAARKFLEIIDRQARRMQAIIDDLLALSRLERDRERSGLALRKVPLEGTLGDALLTCELAARSKRITVELAVEKGLEAKVDPALLEQAVVNLLANAIEYSEEDSAVTVAAAMATEGGQQEGRPIIISVHDHGCGIEAHHIPRLFERFYRVDRSRKRLAGIEGEGRRSHAGTGLGLAIVKHVATLHGGRVVVESRPGEGSTFSIILPQDPAGELDGQC